MEKVQNNLLSFLDDDTFNESILNSLLDELKFHDNKLKLISLLHLILEIANNHHRTPGFFDKIEQILTNFQSNIKTFLSNPEIICIFRSNKRILLFLIEKHIVNVDDYFIRTIIKEKYKESKYPQYFLPEIKPFLNDKLFSKYDEKEKNELIELSNELLKNFDEMRKIGENETLICEIIRKDSINEFISYIKANNCSIDSEISPSFYETNHFLIEESNNKSLALIQYAAFFGSIQIFSYLKSEGAQLTSSLWMHAVHGKNTQIFDLLKESSVDENKNSIICESIKCFHNDIAENLKNKLLDQNENIWYSGFFEEGLAHHNFSYIPIHSIGELRFFDTCIYNHCLIADILLKDAVDALEITTLYSI